VNWRVLVVEDEPDGREVVSEMLKLYNIAVEAVSSAEDALNLLETDQFSGVIIDLNLPGMDGWSLLKAFQSEPRTSHLPCIAITAYHNSTVKHEAMVAGFDAFLPKPLGDSALVRELNRVLAEG